MNRGVSQEHLAAVVAIDDRVLRNYWITQTYFDLASSLSEVLAPATANWCTFATWASRTVGANLRGEALPSWLHDRVLLPDGMMGAVSDATSAHGWSAVKHLVHEVTPGHLLEVVRELLGEMAIYLSEGNTEVFAEIAPPAAILLATHPLGQAPTDDARARVLAACDGATEYQGVNHLRAGYLAWCDALEVQDSVRRSQMILAGSIELAVHEQSHLQDVIVASMDMGVNRALDGLKSKLVRDRRDLESLAHVLEEAMRPLVRSIGDVWDDLMTMTLGTLQSPEGVMRLDHDVPLPVEGPFVPVDLVDVVAPGLAELRRRYDHADATGHGSFAVNWAKLDDRMNFISNLFISRHHESALFAEPFDATTVTLLLGDRVPPPSIEVMREAGTNRPAPTIGVERFTPDFLELLREQGDPPGDRAVDDFFRALDTSRAEVYSLVARAGEAALDDEHAPGIAAYAKKVEPWPAWADERLVRRGQELFGQWGLQFSMGLFLASLPMTYACAKGAEPLVRTSRMTSFPRRRILETGQMIIEAMSPGALMPGARGYRVVRHVRLMHAAVRHTLTHPEAIAAYGGASIEAWDPALGLPLNQEDLLGALLAFSVVGLRSLASVGVDVSAYDQEAYVHAWNLVGYQLGVRADLLPLNYADGREVADRIFAHQSTASAAGRELTATTLAAMQDLVKLRVLRGLPASGVRFFLGDEVADLLGVPPSNWTRHLFGWMRHLDGPVSRYFGRLPGVRSLSAVIGRRVVAGLESVERGPHRAKFEITDELRQAWGIRTS